MGVQVGVGIACILDGPYTRKTASHRRILICLRGWSLSRTTQQNLDPAAPEPDVVLALLVGYVEQQNVPVELLRPGRIFDKQLDVAEFQRGHRAHFNPTTIESGPFSAVALTLSMYWGVAEFGSSGIGRTSALK